MSARRKTRTLAVVSAAVAGLAAVLSGCVGAGTAGGSDALRVTGTDDACRSSTGSVDAGVRTVTFHNTGGQESEIYVLRPDGSAVGERENVGPGLTVQLTVELAPGAYTLRCRPGMVGKGHVAPLTVTGVAASASASRDPRVDAALAAYRSYVEEQAQRSLDGAKELAAAVTAGDLARARTAYPASRVGWERVEPVAESFGDLDPKIDLREADLESGRTWTGWHVLEKGIFQAGSTQGLAPVADRLVADLVDLRSRVRTVEITGTGMANGAVELLDEVSKSKITGEEEAFSHTDLVDVQANVAGARQVVELLRPVLGTKDAALLTELDTRFTALQKVLDGHRTGPADDGFVPYTQVTPDQRRALSASVDAVAEPISRLAGAVAA